MVTISNLVKQYVDSSIIVQEGIRGGIISFGALAEKIKPRIEESLGREAKETAIIMALRRHAEAMAESKPFTMPFPNTSEIIMKTNLVDIGVLKSPSLFKVLEGIYPAMGYEEGDTFNIIHGNRELSFITNKKYLVKVKELLKNETMLDIQENLVSLSMIMTRDFFDTPGVIYRAARKLAWENINIYEVVSTNTELTFIVHRKDATRCYTILQELIDHTESN